MIPWLIGAAVVGIAAAIASSDDDDSKGSQIKRVIKDFWQDVKDAFIKAVSKITKIIIGDRTQVRKDSSGIEHTNEVCYKDSNGDEYVQTTTVKTEKVSNTPDWVNSRKKDITEKRRNIMNDY